MTEPQKAPFPLVLGLDPLTELSWIRGAVAAHKDETTYDAVKRKGEELLATTPSQGALARDTTDAYGLPNNIAIAKEEIAAWRSALEAHGIVGGPDALRKMPTVATVKALIVSWLNRWADEAETIPGPPQYEDALRDAAHGIEEGRYNEEGAPEAIKRESDAWSSQDDRPLPEDDAIDAAFPTRSERHDLYMEAMRMVGAKYTKGALVALVNWLLHERERAKKQ